MKLKFLFSVAFLSFGFVAFWLMGKLNVFNNEGRGSGTRLSLCLAPLFIATLIAVSRTCDYHHHPTDVLAGALLGITIAYLCYRQYYPAFSSQLCSRPYPRRVNNQQNIKQANITESNSVSDGKLLSGTETSSHQQRRLVKDELTDGSDTETKALL